MSQFPMFRLATLLARQISSPVASRIKEYALGHPWFRRRVVIAIGRLYHVVELRSKMWMLALRQPRAVQALAEREALDRGATLLGEIIVFGLGSLIIIFEVNRQANKQEDKALDVASQWAAILMQLEELQRELVLQQQDIDRLMDELRRIAPDKLPPGPPPDLSTKPSELPKPSSELPKSLSEVPKSPPEVPKEPYEAPEVPKEPCKAPEVPKERCEAPEVPKEPCKAPEVPKERCEAPDSPCAAPEPCRAEPRPRTTLLKTQFEGKLLACGGSNSNVYLQELSPNLRESDTNDKVLLGQVFERETKCERILEGRMREIRLKQRQRDEGSPDATSADSDAALGDRDLADAAAEYMAAIKKEQHTF